MRVFKPQYTKPIPEGATIYSRKKVKYAKYKSRGKIVDDIELTADGKKLRCETSHYYIEFEYNGLKRIKAYSNKQSSEALAEKIEKLMHDTMGEDEKRQFIERVDGRISGLIIDYGLMEALRPEKRMSLDCLIAEFEDVLRTTKYIHGFHRSPVYINITISRLKRIVDNCKFFQWQDIKADAIQKYLSSVKITAKTYNGYCQVIKRFCQWVVDCEYADKSPVARKKLSPFRVQAREDKRALTPDELRRLLAATENGPERHKLTGHERAILYLFAAETGIRAKQIKLLTVGDFDFEKLTVTVAAATNKSHRKHTAYMKPERAKQLQGYFRGKMPGARAFPIPFDCRQAEMMRADLKLTKVYGLDGTVTNPAIPYMDSEGRKCSFHSLKHTFATMLDSTDATLNERQALCDHSRQANITDGIYTHVDPARLQSVIEQLPGFDWPGTKAITIKAVG